MAEECVFFLRGYRQHCEVLKARGQGAVSEEDRRRLERSFCASGAFLHCPVFKQLERSLKRVEPVIDLHAASS